MQTLSPQAFQALVRDEQITYLLERLSSMSTSSTREDYACRENKIFFEAARHATTYGAWLLQRAHNIDPLQLLEINELTLEVDRELHEQLSIVERQKFPGMIEPVVEGLLSTARELSTQRIRIGSLGSGSMEAERQFSERWLEQSSPDQRLTIVGCDISLHAHDFARENFSNFDQKKLCFVAAGSVTASQIEELERKHPTSILIISCMNDIFTLGEVFPAGFFDLLMTVLFLHHVTERQEELIASMHALAARVLNYDGYRSNGHLIPMSLAGWRDPVFLNASVFSNLRFLPKKQIEVVHARSTIRYYGHGHFRAL